MPDLGEALAEVLSLEQLHRDVRRVLANAVIEDLHDVRATKLRGRLRLALEARFCLFERRELALDELHRAWNIEPKMRCLPDRPHAPASDEPIQSEATRDDRVLGKLQKGG